MTEIWNPIPGMFGYEASNLGRVRSLKTRDWDTGEPIVMSQHSQHGREYRVVTLSHEGKYRPYGVHRLVLLAFMGEPPEPRMQARHLNGNPTDNRLENLSWGTSSDNTLDQVRHGTHRNGRKTHCMRGHELSGDNLYIRKNGTRLCLPCKRIKENEAYYRRKAT